MAMKRIAAWCCGVLNVLLIVYGAFVARFTFGRHDANTSYVPGARLLNVQIDCSAPVPASSNQESTL